MTSVNQSTKACSAPSSGMVYNCPTWAHNPGWPAHPMQPPLPPHTLSALGHRSPSVPRSPQLLTLGFSLSLPLHSSVLPSSLALSASNFNAPFWSQFAPNPSSMGFWLWRVPTLSVRPCSHYPACWQGGRTGVRGGDEQAEVL